MKPFRSLVSGLLMAALSIAVVVGAFLVTITENRLSQPESLPSPEPITPTAVQMPSTSPTLPSAQTASPVRTLTPTLASPTALPATRTPTASVCPPPPNGWQAYTIQPGDTLAALAALYGVSSTQIMSTNCLVSETLMPGTYIYLPRLLPSATLPFTPTATATRTLIPCGAPPGWVAYIVQAGDTLFKLSNEFGVSVYALQQANCLGSSTLIVVGQRLMVPNVPTRTPTATQQPPQPTDTPVPSLTTIPSATLTPEPSATGTNTTVPTSTPEPSATDRPTPTEVDTPVPSATVSGTP